MLEIVAMATKDLRLLLRDKAGFFFAFFFPLLMAIFFGSIFSGSGGPAASVKVFVVDEDQTVESGEFAGVLMHAEELDAQPATRDEAEEGVRRGQRVASIVILKGFALSNIFAGSPPRVELAVDPVRQAEAGMLQGILTKYASQRMGQVFSDPAAMKKNAEQSKEMVQSSPMPEAPKSALLSFLDELNNLAETEALTTGGGFGGLTPLEIEQTEMAVERIGPRNAFEISFPQGVIWAVLGCTASFGISLILERVRGTLVRLQMAPIGRATILGGKALACFVTHLFLALALFTLGVFVFGIQLAAPLKLAMAVVSTSVCFVGIMMLLAVLGRTEQSAGIGWAVLLILAMTGGGMIPLFVMPEWMQKISHLSPVKWAILSLEGAIWRGFSYSEMLLPCAILVTVGVLSFAAGTRAFRWLG